MLSRFLRCSAPITLIATSFADTGGASVTSVSIPVPNGESGDLLILLFGTNSLRTNTASSGWSSLTSGSRSNVWYKTATTTSEANVVVSFSASAIAGGLVLRYRFANKTPVAGSVTDTAIAGPSTITANAVSGSVAADYLLQCIIDGGSSKSYSTPSVSTGTVFTDSDANQPSMAIFYQYSGSSNAVSTKTGTSSTVNAFQIRLRK